MTTGAAQEDQPTVGPARTCLVIGSESPELRAVTTTLAASAAVTVEVALGTGESAAEVDALRHRIERLMVSANSYVLLAMPGEPPPGRGAELDDVASWPTTRAFYVLQMLVPALSRPGRSIVLVTGADGFASAPGTLRSAVESQGVMALTRVLATEVAPHARACCVAVQGDLLEQADEVCGAICFLLSDDAAHITGQTLVVGRSAVVR